MKHCVVEVRPDRLEWPMDKYISLFLAGTIDMGASHDWQSEFVDTAFTKIQDPSDRDIKFVILNPRRADWDSSWEQSKYNQDFALQVNWELVNMTEAHYVLFYFAPSSRSPITMMELGFMAGSLTNSQKCVVVCPEGFYRKGNVDIMCDMCGIHQEDSLDDALAYIARRAAFRIVDTV